jgi:hypothetical protein
MVSKVSFERATAIIQGWYQHYCNETGAAHATLEIQEKDESVSYAYKITNPDTGKSTTFFWSYVSDYENMGAVGIPGDLKTGIWETFHDIT